MERLTEKEDEVMRHHQTKTNWKGWKKHKNGHSSKKLGRQHTRPTHQGFEGFLPCMQKAACRVDLGDWCG